MLNMEGNHSKLGGKKRSQISVPQPCQKPCFHRTLDTSPAKIWKEDSEASGFEILYMSNRIPQKKPTVLKVLSFSPKQQIF